MIPEQLRRISALGSGVGIQIEGRRGAESLRIAAVRVRPGSAKALGTMVVEDFPAQRAATWGTDYAAFLRKHGMKDALATVILPRTDVIVRPVSLPGVGDADLGAAIRFQLENLHPHNEDDVATGWERLPGTSTVLVVIARRDAIERYTAVFAEAGVRVGSITCSAAALYSAARFFGSARLRPFFAMEQGDQGVEVYAESSARPLYAASLPLAAADRATSLVAAELRMDEGSSPTPISFDALVGGGPALPLAAGMLSACPRHGLAVNLLPETMRQTGSTLWIPAVALGGIALALAAAAAYIPNYQEGRYNAALDKEIASLTPRAARAADLDSKAAGVSAQIAALVQFRSRPKADMEILGELTRLLPPPTWLTQTEIGPSQVLLTGETDQAAALLKLLDASPYFQNSEFTAPPQRTKDGEQFHIRTTREPGR